VDIAYFKMVNTGNLRAPLLSDTDNLSPATGLDVHNHVTEEFQEEGTKNESISTIFFQCVFSNCCFFPLMAFFFYAYFKDDAAENVRSGDNGDCTNFPLIFFIFLNLCSAEWFISMFLICIQYCTYSKSKDDEAKTISCLCCIACILSALALCSLVPVIWAPIELFTMKDDCKDYIREIGGELFWIACQILAYLAIAMFGLVCCSCICIACCGTACTFFISVMMRKESEENQQTAKWLSSHIHNHLYFQWI